MSTRLYFPSNLGAPIVIDVEDQWDDRYSYIGFEDWNQVNNFFSGSLRSVKQNSPFLLKSILSPDVGSVILFGQFISAPLVGSGSLTGSIKCQLRTKQSAAYPPTDFEEWLIVGVVSGDGTVLRGISIDRYANVGPFETDLTNRQFASGQSLTSVNFQEGDRLVVEVGVNIATAGQTGFIEFGDESETDLPENNTETEQHTPWVEFSQNLSFGSEPNPTGFKSPNAAASADRDNKTAWSNPNNAKVDDTSNADMTLPASDYSDWLRVTEFGFTSDDIPEGNEIVGIEVGVKRSADVSNQIQDDVVKLRGSSGQVGDNKAKPEAWATAETFMWYGSIDDLWNALLTREDILSGDFGVDISVKNNDNGNSHNPKINHIKVKIYHREQEDEPTKRRQWKIYPEPRTDQPKEVHVVEKEALWQY